MAVEFNIEIRKKQLESLDQFVTCSRERVQSILDCLGWSVDRIQEPKLLIKCPYDDNHKVPAEKIEDHSKKCEAKSAGYDLQEEFISEPNKLLDESNIKIDIDKKLEVLRQALSQKPYFRSAWNGKDPDPQTYSRLVSTFSSDERLVLYDYSVANTKGPAELPEFDTSIVTKDKGDTSFTRQALLSFERDIKRRSVKYKPVHTHHKNYKEVLKDVIDSQMQQYSIWLENINGSKGPCTPDSFSTEEPIEELQNPNKYLEYIDRPHSSVSKFSNNSSGSHGTRYERRSRTSHFDSQFPLDEGVKKDYNKEHHSNYSTHLSKRRYKYTHRDESSQESNNISKVSPSDIDSSSENYENTSRAHSRNSSTHNSHRYKEKNDKYRESRRHKSRSDDRERKKRDYSSGSSKHSSRSHRSKEDKSHRHHFREKSRRHKYPNRES